MGPRSQIVLVDMDGTLADVGHRLHFINQAARRKNWERFFEGMDADMPIAEIADWVRELAREYRIVIVTGRPEAYRERTIRWLERFGVPWDEMHMRPDGDHRPDHIVKKQILDSLGPRRDLIAFVIDDRPSVCDMWRAAGLKCHQVGNPEEFRKSR
jgi:phosphoglycolate phosphatase-like HAD superfamily hydrolase